MALKQFSFYKPFTNFVKHGTNEQVLITDVDSEGDTLQELLDNATIGLEDMHGNTLQHCKLQDLAEEDYNIVIAHVNKIYLLQKAQDATKNSGLEWQTESE